MTDHRHVATVSVVAPASPDWRACLVELGSTADGDKVVLASCEEVIAWRVPHEGDARPVPITERGPGTWPHKVTEKCSVVPKDVSKPDDSTCVPAFAAARSAR
jgi:hypothetical protein